MARRRGGFIGGFRPKKHKDKATQKIEPPKRGEPIKAIRPDDKDLVEMAKVVEATAMRECLEKTPPEMRRRWASGEFKYRPNGALVEFTVRLRHDNKRDEITAFITVPIVVVKKRDEQRMKAVGSQLADAITVQLRKFEHKRSAVERAIDNQHQRRHQIEGTLAEAVEKQSKKAVTTQDLIR
jgi:hypothetical protein